MRQIVKKNSHAVAYWVAFWTGFLILVACTPAARSAWEKRVRVAADSCREYLDATTGDTSTPEGYVRVACQGFDALEPEIVLLLESEIWDHMKKKSAATVTDAGIPRND